MGSARPVLSQLWPYMEARWFSKQTLDIWSAETNGKHSCCFCHVGGRTRGGPATSFSQFQSCHCYGNWNFTGKVMRNFHLLYWLLDSPAIQRHENNYMYWLTSSKLQLKRSRSSIRVLERHTKEFWRCASRDRWVLPPLTQDREPAGMDQRAECQWECWAILSQCR